MRKPLTRSPFASGTTNRFGRSSLGEGITVLNSNAKVSVPRRHAANIQPAAGDTQPWQRSNLGLNSDRLRSSMVDRLRSQGSDNETVLGAMLAVPRHVFVDEGLASRAYEDAALPIGHGQTISQPWVVARMISAICENRQPAKVLEVGAGCGYQAAALGQFVREVHAVER